MSVCGHAVSGDIEDKNVGSTHAQRLDTFLESIRIGRVVEIRQDELRDFVRMIFRGIGQ